MLQTTLKEDTKEDSAINISAPVFIVHGGRAYWLSEDGEIITPSNIELSQLLQKNKPIVCNAPLVAKQMNIPQFEAYDLLELFAFVRPAQFCVPNLSGLVQKLKLTDIQIKTASDKCLACLEISNQLLQNLKDNTKYKLSDPIMIAFIMGICDTSDSQNRGWAWSHAIFETLGVSAEDTISSNAKKSIQIWNRLPEWAEEAPPPPASHMPVSKKESLDRLNEILSHRSGNTRIRNEQKEYARAVTDSFQPKEHKEHITTVMAEAGTGTGKTLGYLAPASVWADKNDGCVWISTYTKNLQKQIDVELNNLYQNSADKARNVIIRKGRENYLCLLNLEEAINSPAIQNNPKHAIAMGLIARWAAVSRDGDLYGGDFPSWLVGILGWKYTYGLADRRGECMFSACPHYHKCFIEKTSRLAKRAKIVIANHALVMNKTAVSHPHDVLGNRYIFDEGHHIFSAADSAFAVHLSGMEAAELRRWILGNENSNNRNNRNRGLKKRIEELISDDDEAMEALDDIIKNSRMLPSKSWRQRLQSEQPKGLMEGFLFLVRQQIYARNTNMQDSVYSLETEALPPIEGLFETAYTLSLRLKDILKPIKRIVRTLENKLEKYADTMESDTKARIESICHSLTYRADNLIQCWIDMLNSIQNQAADDRFIDWFQLEKIEGREYDVGMYRHWVDPTIPFANCIKSYADGITITSASLLDSAKATEEEWQYAKKHSGATNIAPNENDIKKLQIQSPYNYQKQSKIIVINDLNINNIKQVTAAYLALFKAANGGALGLFTAIQRLKAVHELLLPEMQKLGIDLYAQHVDGLDTSTLTEIFKIEINSCMLGTDATRDGMDVPGKSLRLIVFDRVPWARPDILHKARRKYFGKGYDDKVTRARLKQAYGRLIRHENDRGVFVMLDSRLPSRLCSAFPSDVEIKRIGLAEAVKEIKKFL